MTVPEAHKHPVRVPVYNVVKYEHLTRQPMGGCAPMLQPISEIMKLCIAHLSLEVDAKSSQSIRS